MSTRSTVWANERGPIGIHLYREMLNDRYMVAIGRMSNAYSRLVIKLWRYRKRTAA
jgi:hypothetical protein